MLKKIDVYHFYVERQFPNNFVWLLSVFGGLHSPPTWPEHCSGGHPQPPRSPPATDQCWHQGSNKWSHPGHNWLVAPPAASPQVCGPAGTSPPEPPRRESVLRPRWMLCWITTTPPTHLHHYHTTITTPPHCVRSSLHRTIYPHITYE